MEILDIEWARCLDGYKIVEMKPLGAKEEAYFSARPWIDRTYLTSSLIIRNSTRMERYRPLKNLLFVIFAKWDPSPEGMVGFCNAYGPLQAAPNGVTFTPVDWMLDQHKILQHALTMLDSGDSAELSKLLEWEHHGRCAFVLRPGATGSISLALIPESLEQAMWIQLAFHAASQPKLWSCDQCGTPFYVGTGTKRRSTAKYCSNACKVAAYKNRHGLAKTDA
jgi:hypothetical protein